MQYVHSGTAYPGPRGSGLQVRLFWCPLGGAEGSRKTGSPGPVRPGVGEPSEVAPRRTLARDRGEPAVHGCLRRLEAGRQLPAAGATTQQDTVIAANIASSSMCATSPVFGRIRCWRQQTPSQTPQPVQNNPSSPPPSSSATTNQLSRTLSHGYSKCDMCGSVVGEADLGKQPAQPSWGPPGGAAGQAEQDGQKHQSDKEGVE